MSNRIKVSAVSDVVKEKKYTYVTVAYESNGKVFEKKVVNFQNEDVYDTIKEAKKGEEYDVEVKKNPKGFWEWVGITKVDNRITSSTASVSASTTRSNYETPEERAKRQVYIVRQSSISSAIQLLLASTPQNGNAGGTSGYIPVSVPAVIEVAKQFEKYVFSTSLNEFVDDKPWEDKDDE